jgi:hypothetical protein
MNITLDHDLILNALRDADMSADDLRMDYSGRGMYGSDCFGIVGDVQDLALFMVAITDRMSQMDYPTNGDVTAWIATSSFTSQATGWLKMRTSSSS